MMEGEAGTPAVSVRVPNEETAFVEKNVDAPSRRESRMRVEKKRMAFMGVSLVVILALAGVCAFVAAPSSSNAEATVSEVAMASDSANSVSGQVFVPSFDDYDEDKDGTISLGEFLDRMNVNLNAAIARVEASSLSDSSKAQIKQDLNDDFASNSDCAMQFVQQLGDETITRDNFDKIYVQLTADACPFSDARIPDEFQASETANLQEEQPLTEGSSAVVSPAASWASSSPESQGANTDTANPGSDQVNVEANSANEEASADQAPSGDQASTDDADQISTETSGSSQSTDVSTTSSGENAAQGSSSEEPPAEDQAATDEASSAGQDFDQASAEGSASLESNPTALNSAASSTSEAQDQEAANAGQGSSQASVEGSTSAESPDSTWNPEMPMNAPITSNSGETSDNETPQASSASQTQSDQTSSDASSSTEASGDLNPNSGENAAGGSSRAESQPPVDETPSDQAQSAQSGTSPAAQSPTQTWNPDLPTDVPKTKSNAAGDHAQPQQASSASQTQGDQAPTSPWNPEMPTDVLKVTNNSSDNEAPPQQASSAGQTQSDQSPTYWNPDMHTTTSSGGSIAEEPPVNESPVVQDALDGYPLQDIPDAEVSAQGPTQSDQSSTSAETGNSDMQTATSSAGSAAEEPPVNESPIERDALDGYPLADIPDAEAPAQGPTEAPTPDPLAGYPLPADEIPEDNVPAGKTTYKASLDDDNSQAYYQDSSAKASLRGSNDA